MEDIEFGITLQDFNEGNSPLSHIEEKTFVGNKGQSSDAQADVVSNPSYLSQSPAIANLTNGDENGVVTELIRQILDQPTATDETYAIGTSKLFKLSSTAVASGGSPSWPQAVTGMVEGECVVRLKANIYGFYNKSSGGDILKMPLSTEVIDEDWGSSTDVALEDAPHPAAVKEDIMLFGNGRYVGVYIEGAATLDNQALDFGEGAEVADVVFNSNYWWIAVNYGEGRRSQIFLYDGSALSSILADEVGVGQQKIGFLYVQNGIIFIAYQDQGATGYNFGFLSGKVIKPLRYFSGSLPDHRQKTLYKNTIIFASNGKIMSCGAAVQQLPIQISRLADGGHATLGAVAAPFGTPMVASTDGSTGFRLAKFSGLDTSSYWKSLWIDLTQMRNIGKIQAVIVQTKPLGANARADLTIEGNQGQATDSSPMEISGENVTRHVFTDVDIDPVEDARVFVSWENGDANQDCPIRKIILLGSYVER